MSNTVYHSKHGGMWIDAKDWRERLADRHLSQEDKDRLERFVRDGYIILAQAASPEAVDAFQAEIARSFRFGNPDVLFQSHGSQETLPLTEAVDRLGSRVVDAYVPLRQALDLFSSPELVRFLRLIFDEDPLLFQGLNFDQGSQQGLHQDTAYVVLNRPMELAACWIALEDVQAGSGELMYSPGSHRLPDWDFGPDRKHWDRSVDGDATHDEWSHFLRSKAEASEHGIQTFLARKGDILVWHADLAHGGSPVTRPELTRQSLVGHFCPLSGRPRYFDHGPIRHTVRRWGSIAYSSGHYDLALRDAPEPVALPEGASSSPHIMADPEAASSTNLL